MKLIYGLLVLVGVTCGHHLRSPILLPTTTLVRTPQYDSAIVQNERIGGSFSYSTIEGHAYETVVPLVRTEYQYLNPVPLPLAYNYQVPKLLIAPIQTIQPLEQNQLLKPVGAASMASEIKKIEKQSEKKLKEPANDDDDTVAIEAA